MQIKATPRSNHVQTTHKPLQYFMQTSAKPYPTDPGPGRPGLVILLLSLVTYQVREFVTLQSPTWAQDKSNEVLTLIPFDQSPTRPGPARPGPARYDPVM